MTEHRRKSIYRRYCNVDERMLREGVEKLATLGKEGGKVGPFPGESFPSCVEDSACVMDNLDKNWAVSSAGRALPSHGRGRRFEPCTAHQKSTTYNVGRFPGPSV